MFTHSTPFNFIVFLSFSFLQSITNFLQSSPVILQCLLLSDSVDVQPVNNIKINVNSSGKSALREPQCPICCIEKGFDFENVTASVNGRKRSNLFR